MGGMGYEFVFGICGRSGGGCQGRRIWCILCGVRPRRIRIWVVGVGVVIVVVIVVPGSARLWSVSSGLHPPPWSYSVSVAVSPSLAWRRFYVI